MGILDTVKSIFGGGAGRNQNELMSVIMGLIGGQGGGIGNLVQQFTQKGMGDVVSSWISTGKNLPVSAQQIENVFGSDTINGLASKLKMNPADLSGKISDLMPQLVDKLTPDGKIPEGDILQQGKNILGSLLGGK